MQASLRTRVLRVLHYNAARSGWRNPGDQCDHAGRLLLAGGQLRRNIVTARSHVGTLASDSVVLRAGPSPPKMGGRTEKSRGFS